MGRHRTAQEKLRIISEVRTGTLSVSQICRRHGVSPSMFYLWQKQLEEGGLTGLDRDTTKQAEERVQELEAENARLKAIIAEVVDENLKIKKGRWA